MPTFPRFKVAICGGGIGGLTTALALARYPDIEVEIFEGASSLGEVGAGIGLFPRPWKVMQILGIDQDLLKFTDIKPRDGPVSAFHYRKSDQTEGFQFYTLITNGQLITLHRADFQSVLLNRLPKSCSIQVSKRLRNYEQSLKGHIDLFFEDGTTSKCDVLIGADGLKSSVRRGLLIEKARWARNEGRKQEASDCLSAIEPLWTGTIAYRAVIPAEVLRKRHPDHSALHCPMQYLGKNGYIIAYPIQQRRMVNFVAFSSRHDLENTHFTGPWVSVTDKSTFASTFANWESEVQALIDCSDKPLRWAIHTVKPMRSFVSGRVALVGDAAHAMSPHQGSGAGQAIEDAFILATVLGHHSTTRETLYRSLRVYDEVRRPYALQVQEKSRLNGRYFSLELEGKAGGVNLDRLPHHVQFQHLQHLGQKFTRNWEWTWLSSIDDLIQQSLVMLA